MGSLGFIPQGFRVSGSERVLGIICRIMGLRKKALSRVIRVIWFVIFVIPDGLAQLTF